MPTISEKGWAFSKTAALPTFGLLWLSWELPCTYVCVT